MQSNDKLTVRSLLLAVLSGLLAAFNLKVFVHAGNLTPAGFSGTAVVLERLSETYLPFKLSYGVLYLLLNIPGTVVILKTLGKRFTILSRIDIFLTATLVSFIPALDITNDLLLISIFGGVLNRLACLGQRGRFFSA